MKVDVNDIKKIVLLWKSTSEKNQPVPDEIQKQLDMYRNKKYRVIIMYSGSEDLFEPTLVLLLKNRMNKAMKEAEQELIEGKAAV